MHLFQPLDINDITLNPFTQISKDWFALTASDGNKTNTMTAAWGGLGVMWGKNVVFAVVRDSRYTKEFIDAADTFSLTFFDMSKKSNRSALQYLGAVSGRDEDKIGSAHLNINYHDGTPFIDEGNMVYICRKMYAGPMPKDFFTDNEIDAKWYGNNDYHNLYIGEITAFLAR